MENVTVQNKTQVDENTPRPAKKNHVAKFLRYEINISEGSTGADIKTRVNAFVANTHLEIKEYAISRYTDPNTNVDVVRIIPKPIAAKCNVHKSPKHVFKQEIEEGCFAIVGLFYWNVMGTAKPYVKPTEVAFSLD